MAVTFSQAVAEYLQHCESRGLSEGTVRARRSALELFQQVIGDIQLKNVTHRHVDQVFSRFGWQPSTRNTKLSIYRSFFNWAQARGHVKRDQDPLFGWRMVKVPEVDRTRIPVQEWPKLFSLVQHPTEQIVLGLGLYLFLRASEIQHLRLQHVHLADGEIEIFRPKTQEWDSMPICAELDRHLRQHLTWLAEQNVAAPEHFLVPARRKDLKRDAGNRFIPGSGTLNPERSLSHPHRAVQRVLKRAGYATHGEGEHTLRRSGARAYFDQLAADGYDGALRRVQAMLGHKSSMMTEVYLGLSLDRRARNEALKGKPMFPELESVPSLRAVHG